MNVAFGLGSQAGAPRDTDAVRAAVRDVLARDEFGGEESLLQRFLGWLGERFGRDFSLDGDTVRMLAVVTVVVLSVVALWLLVRALRAGEAERARDQAAARVERAEEARRRAAALRRRAAAARAGGDLRLAQRLYFFALVVGLGATGDLVYRDAWTNRELLARGRPPRDIHALLAPLVERLEAKDFGHVPTTDEDVARLAALCEERLGPLGPASADEEVAA